MAIVNIRDRASIRRAYSRHAFASDAAHNDRQTVDTLKGVRIAAAPDDDGNFPLQRAARQTGETPGAVFLAPFTAVGSADADLRKGYEAFLDDIVAAAAQHGYRADTSPGPGDERIKGLRQ